MLESNALIHSIPAFNLSFVKNIFLKKPQVKIEWAPREVFRDLETQHGFYLVLSAMEVVKEVDLI